MDWAIVWYTQLHLYSINGYIQVYTFRLCLWIYLYGAKSIVRKRFNVQKSKQCKKDNSRNYIECTFLNIIYTFRRLSHASFCFEKKKEPTDFLHWFVKIQSEKFLICVCVCTINTKCGTGRRKTPKSRQFPKWLLCEYCASLSAILCRHQIKKEKQNKRTNEKRLHSNKRHELLR